MIKTHCKHGHDLSLVGIYLSPNKKHYECKQCRKLSREKNWQKWWYSHRNNPIWWENRKEKMRKKPKPNLSLF